MREGHLQQAFVAARGAEAAGLHAAKWHAGIGGRDDEVVDEDKAGLDARGECAGLRDVAGENGSAEREACGVRPMHGGGIVADTLDEETRNVSGGEPCEQIVGDGLHNDEPARRDAGLSCVQSRAEAQRAHDKIEIGVGEDEHGVLAGEFHHGRSVCPGERGENLAAVFGRAGEDDFVHAVGDGAARGFNALGQNGEQRGIEAGAAREVRKGERDLARAGRGFEQHGIARDECVQRMNRGQEERIVSRPDHEHDTERLPLHFERNALQPKRTATLAAATRREHAAGIALQPAARIGEREDFGDELLGEWTIAHRCRRQRRARPRFPR